MFKAAAVCPWAAYQCVELLCICQRWMQEAVWDDWQPQPWCNDIILTLQVTHSPKIWPQSSVGISVQSCFLKPMDSISMCSNMFYMSNMDAGSSGWGGCQCQPWHIDIILTPHVTQNPKIWANEGGYNCLRLLPYAHGQHINAHQHFVYV